VAVGDDDGVIDRVRALVPGGVDAVFDTVGAGTIPGRSPQARTKPVEPPWVQEWLLI
jgi:hypothetical protein